MMKSFLFYNAKVLTFNADNDITEAILIFGNKIHSVGSYSELKKFSNKNTTYIDLEGKVLLPGFVDTHTHFFSHSKLRESIYLENAKSVAEIESILKKYPISNNNIWIEGFGWDLNRYPDSEKFNVKLLDKYFPDNPVSLSSHDAHTHLCNSVALKRMGISKNTPDPNGGKFGHFSDSSLNGFLYEKTWELITKHKPALQNDKKINIIKKAIKHSWKLGLVGVHDMETLTEFELFKQIPFDEFPFRFYFHFRYNNLDKMINNDVKCYNNVEEKRKICGMKIFADGALGSHSAYMFDNYPNEPDNFGISIQKKEELFNLVMKAAKHNIPSTIHAIGDKANSEVIDIYDKVNNEVGWLPHRIEHFQCVRPSEYRKVVANKIHCAVQPIHMKEDITTIGKLWKNVAHYTYSFKDQIENGICLSFGSDAPIETINPFQGIYSAITRKSKNNPNNASWFPKQILTIWEALKGYTINAAKASQSEKVRGSLEKNKFADIIVLDNFFTEENEFWLTAKSRLTMVDGKIVYKDI